MRRLYWGGISCVCVVGVREDVRVDDHDLSELAVGPSCAVKEHGLGRGHGHVEGADISLSVHEGDASAVDTTLHGLACCVGGTLRDSVVAVAELELDNVADRSGDGVGDENVLDATDDNRDDLSSATNMPDSGCIGISLGGSKDRRERTIVGGQLVDRAERGQSSGSRDEQGEDVGLHRDGLDGQKKTS